MTVSPAGPGSPRRIQPAVWLVAGVVLALLAGATGLLWLGRSRAPGAGGAPGGGASMAAAFQPEPGEAPGGWLVRRTEQERPTIRLLSPASTLDPRDVVVFDDGKQVYELRVDGRDVSMQIPAGEYEYAFRGPLYRATGQPDQSGTFRCRKFRSYEAEVVTTTDPTPKRRDLGD